MVVVIPFWLGRVLDVASNLGVSNLGVSPQGRDLIVYILSAWRKEGSMVSVKGRRNGWGEEKRGRGERGG